MAGIPIASMDTALIAMIMELYTCGSSAIPSGALMNEPTLYLRISSSPSFVNFPLSQTAVMLSCVICPTFSSKVISASFFATLFSSSISVSIAGLEPFRHPHTHMAKTMAKSSGLFIFSVLYNFSVISRSTIKTNDSAEPTMESFFVLNKNILSFLPWV